MKHLLNLLAAIALLVWGTQLVRTGVLRVFGANLRQFIASGVSNRLRAVLSGVGVTTIVQSSTATALIVSSFVGQGMVSLTAALAVMLGADVGTSVMAVVFSLDLSWLSPLFIFVGVVMFISRQDTTVGRVGRVFIGLGLMLLALRLITESTTVLTQSPVMVTLLEALTSDITMEVLTGALIAIISYSSLATVLLVATLAASGGIPVDVALGLVIGANLGSGLLAVLTTLKTSVQTRQVPLGNLMFKMIGVVLMIPLVNPWFHHMRHVVPDVGSLVVLFHLAFNTVVALVCILLTGKVAWLVQKILPVQVPSPSTSRPHHLDASALSTPSLAISCAAREALHQADVVESMLIGLQQVWQTDDQKLAQDLRKLDDEVDQLYSAIKYYMTKISRAELDETEGRRWTDIISFTINMEQVGDLIERVLQDVEDKKIKKGRQFSQAGLEEINRMHGHLLANLRLAMSVFLNGNVRDAQKLLEEKARFRDLELAYSANHLDRLSENTVQSIETSSLHIDLISDLKRINSLLCSVAYPILESTGALAPSRLREPVGTPH
ncbi:Na/Pi cotransporter family protein [Comamonas aquatica]|jgi:phosphate:Na+ symporter|uniref:Sodium-dependent inorganic phosphate (Pi) transporter n=1 Tax=Comamonas aquatica TaxID=225991 RepID=A0AA35D6G2_9BURK|nr:Na/Pi cotransporter family protein [Comamonas aquatica]CAB5643197.1 sodium-dependent inorganic phosphate (Pi) transporter [Comamonas aquatica]CAB5663598.1 sodium-dependent inorganic phosphate (Pi) transporter [Comamonas aquatica]CAC9175002.1 sodium-dependent inorganic phosphate (Pi) transporter [Comamonas aquatica]CAC9679989.1 sodium-dependent inorganic phosphate (Pi) transporter [Comamonas aquatica]